MSELDDLGFPRDRHALPESVRTDLRTLNLECESTTMMWQQVPTVYEHVLVVTTVDGVEHAIVWSTTFGMATREEAELRRGEYLQDTEGAEESLRAVFQHAVYPTAAGWVVTAHIVSARHDVRVRSVKGDDEIAACERERISAPADFDPAAAWLADRASTPNALLGYSQGADLGAPYNRVEKTN